MHIVLRSICLSLHVVLLLCNLNAVGTIVLDHPRDSSSSSPPSQNDPDLDGIRNLVARRLPKSAQSFDFSFIEGFGDAFVISDSSDAGGIAIGCTTPSACARGLYTYLKEFGRIDIWWTGSRLDQLVSPLPKVGNPIKGISIVDYRYYFNTVTFSYTTVFYNLDQWYLLLDWMALKGINLPLAWVGYEYIFLETLKQIGMTEEDIIPFFSGPAFLAWNRFGNIQGSWGGSDLPLQWINDQFALQKSIVARMVELGMTPVLPSFTGFLPCSITKLDPGLNVVQGSQWSGFPSTLTDDCFLAPSEPLFTAIQKLFIQNQKAAYGNISSMYTLDQYNENNPFSGNLSYLQNISSNTFQSLRAADPGAIWIMQGWLFFSNSAFWTLDRISAYLGGVSDPDGMLILDLYSEAQPQWQRTSSYENRPWIWCELHDYGQNQGFEGYLRNVTVTPVEALHSPNSTMKGVGLTMEGQEGNEIVYDILLDQAWSISPISISEYVTSWVNRRYQIAEQEEHSDASSRVQAAWSILSSTVYDNSDPNTQATVKSILELSPALSGLVNRTGHHPTEIFYDTNTTILAALRLLVQASAEDTKLTTIPEFAHDVVDLTRQLLVNRFQETYTLLVSQYSNSDITLDSFAATIQKLQTILTTLDALLYTNSDFLLSSWIDSAKDLAYGNETYAKLLEYNARNQITLWGPTGQIDDYASKQWAGLVGTYYLPRWMMFANYLTETKRDSVPYNATFISEQLVDFGVEWDTRTWGENPGEYPGTQGNTWKTVGRILEIYG